MNKQEFLDKLKIRLSSLPNTEIEERLNFYSEMIEDRIEEGLSEEEAVLAVGSIDEITVQIPDTASSSEMTNNKKHLSLSVILLLAIGSPIWIALGVAAFAVVISLYAALWSLIAAAWAVFAALVGSAFGCVAGSTFIFLQGYPLSGIASIAAGLVCAGLSVFAFSGCLEATKGVVKLTVKIISSSKKLLSKKEAV